MTDDKIKILVVDDDPQLLAVLEAGLSLNDDYVVTSTTQAQEARKLVMAEKFDLVVTDYSLNDPEIDGLGILREVREKQPRCLVVIITAYASLEISLEAIHLGAYDFLTKPFQLDELQLVVRNATQQIRLDHENQRLHSQLGEMMQALQEIETQHSTLLNNMQDLGSDAGLGNATVGGSGMTPLTSPLPGNGLAGGGLPSGGGEGADAKRFQMRQQISNYLKVGETIREQLSRERERIEVMFKNGLLTEESYRKAISKHPKLAEKPSDKTTTPGS